jgi:hypothetical protein
MLVLARFVFLQRTTANHLAAEVIFSVGKDPGVAKFRSQVLGLFGNWFKTMLLLKCSNPTADRGRES